MHTYTFTYIAKYIAWLNLRLPRAAPRDGDRLTVLLSGIMLYRNTLSYHYPRVPGIASCGIMPHHITSCPKDDPNIATELEHLELRLRGTCQTNINLIASLNLRCVIFRLENAGFDSRLDLTYEA